MGRYESNEVDELRGTFLSGIFSPKNLSFIALTVTGVVALFLSPMILETNNAGYYKILQKPVTGTMRAYTAPGMFFQGFGDVFTYRASDILYFSKHESEGRNEDNSIEVRFNDGATAKVTGNVRVDLPNDPEKLIELQKKFRSYDSLIKDTVKQTVAEAAILTAALMTAEDSYTTKRAEFGHMIEDQLRNGVYLTESRTISVKDPKTGETVNRNIVTIQLDKNGNPERKESVLSRYGIHIAQSIIKEIDYEKNVADQITTKQQALMNVVAAKAQAEKAVQDRLTAEEVGRKNVAVAKYEQEVEKAKAVTSAEKELDVARLNKQAAEQYKQTQILKAEGDAEYRRRVMQADGALEKKLTTYEKVQQFWAEAFANAKNPVVPSVIMGGGQNGQSGNAALTMMEIMGIKAARDLSLDMKATGNTTK